VQVKRKLVKLNFIRATYIIFVEIQVVLNQTIYVKDIVKHYGKRAVVNHVSFHVQQGEIVGLLGPNGAGKTTSFYQVVGLIRPDKWRYLFE